MRGNDKGMKTLEFLEKLEAWRCARELAIAVRVSTKEWPKEERFALIDQVLGFFPVGKMRHQFVVAEGDAFVGGGIH